MLRRACRRMVAIAIVVSVMGAGIHAAPVHAGGGDGAPGPFSLVNPTPVPTPAQ